MLRILRGELTDYEGQMRFDSVEFDDLPKEAVRGAIAYISQDIHA